MTFRRRYLLSPDPVDIRLQDVCDPMANRPLEWIGGIPVLARRQRLPWQSITDRDMGIVVVWRQVFLNPLQAIRVPAVATSTAGPAPVVRRVGGDRRTAQHCRAADQHGREERRYLNSASGSVRWSTPSSRMVNRGLIRSGASGERRSLAPRKSCPRGCFNTGARR